MKELESRDKVQEARFKEIAKELPGRIYGADTEEIRYNSSIT
jgi:hypothetical protein